MSRGGCGDLCSYCDKSYLDFTGPVSKRNLIGALQANIFDRGSVRADKFVTFITDKDNDYKLRKSIWGEKAVVPAGKIHALVLQLFVSGLVTLSLSDDQKEGTDKVALKDVSVSLSKITREDDDGSYDTLALFDDTLWCGFNLKN